MEFYQFHPTVLFNPQAKSFLISEALRGEGAILRRMDGTPFMADHDPRKELAPRDIVARAIDYEMKKSGSDHVWLDITHRGEAFVREHFPGIYAECLSFGVDITKQLTRYPRAIGLSAAVSGKTLSPRILAPSPR